MEAVLYALGGSAAGALLGVVSMMRAEGPDQMRTRLIASVVGLGVVDFLFVWRLGASLDGSAPALVALVGFNVFAIAGALITMYLRRR